MCCVVATEEEGEEEEELTTHAVSFFSFSFPFFRPLHHFLIGPFSFLTNLDTPLFRRFNFSLLSGYAT